MREILNSVFVKTKYLLMILAALFCIIPILYISHVYSSPIINSDILFRRLLCCDIVIIFFVSGSIYKLINNDPTLRINLSLVKDELSDGGSLFNTINEGIIVADKKGMIRNINQGLCNMLGLEEKKIINNNLYNLINDWGFDDERKALPLLITDSLESQQEFRQKEKVLVLDTEVLYLAISTYILRNKFRNVVGILAVVHDFTHKRNLEKQLLHVEKLANAGQMAAELAHEIKNPICSIKGLIQIIGKKYSIEDSKYYQVITNEMDRINVLLQGFLTLTKKKTVFEITSITSIIAEIMPLVEGYAESKNVSIYVDMQKEIPLINVDKENIKQVIINIAQNGIDALHKNGRMNISIWYDQINELIKMEFKDNGRGINPKYLDRIFEPFFTTKDNGTGLGLAISCKIIENHYGRIFAFNNLDGGATFVVEIPVVNN